MTYSYYDPNWGKPDFDQLMELYLQWQNAAKNTPGADNSLAYIVRSLQDGVARDPVAFLLNPTISDRQRIKAAEHRLTKIERHLGIHPSAKTSTPK